MNITKEMFQSAKEKKMKRMRIYNIISAISVITVFALDGIVLIIALKGIFTMGASSSLQSLKALLLINVLALILYYLFTLFSDRFLTKERHFPLSSNIDHLMKKLMKDYYSNDFMSWAANLMCTEKKLLCRGFARRLLIDGNIFRGEFEIAMRNNVYDRELFDKDSYYELYYLSFRACCYYQLPNGANYAEEAYRSFWQLFENGPVDRGDSIFLSLALETEISHAAFHGQWQEVLNLTDIFCTAYSDFVTRSQETGTRIEYSMIMMRKAEALYHQGRSDEAMAIANEWAEYLRPFPYQYNKAQQLLQEISQK